MILSSEVKIRFGHLVITDKILAKHRKQWIADNGQHYHPRAIIGDEVKAPDRLVFYVLLFGYTPFIITGDKNKPPLVFDATMRRFPYRLLDPQMRRLTGLPPEDGWKHSAFALRLIPRQGQVKEVKLDTEWTDYLHEDNLSIGPDRIFAQIGNGHVRVEIFFQSIKETLGELLPPDGFREEVVVPERQLAP